MGKQLDLFNRPEASAQDPDVRILSFDPVDFDYRELRDAVDWQQRSVTVYGKTYPQPRLTKWYGPVGYHYSGLGWPAEPLPALLAEILKRTEDLVGEPLNSVLCNLYRDGDDCVGWHADDEPLFGGDPVVASLSFGATRIFKIRSADWQRDYHLDDGSLLVMGRGVQRSCQHSLPRTRATVGERLNLTFRQVV